MLKHTNTHTCRHTHTHAHKHTHTHTGEYSIVDKSQLPYNKYYHGEKTLYVLNQVPFSSEEI